MVEPMFRMTLSDAFRHLGDCLIAADRPDTWEDEAVAALLKLQMHTLVELAKAEGSGDHERATNRKEMLGELARLLHLADEEQVDRVHRLMVAAGVAEGQRRQRLN